MGYVAAATRKESNSFAKLFGIYPNMDPFHHSRGYSKGELYTKKEIFDILKEEGFISEGLVGRIKGELMFHFGDFEIHPGEYFKFEQEDLFSGRYRLVRRFDYG